MTSALTCGGVGSGPSVGLTIWIEIQVSAVIAKLGVRFRTKSSSLTPAVHQRRAATLLEEGCNFNWPNACQNQ